MKHDEALKRVLLCLVVYILELLIEVLRGVDAFQSLTRELLPVIWVRWNWTAVGDAVMKFF